MRDQDQLLDPESSPEMRKHFEDLLAEQGIEALDDRIPRRKTEGPAPLSFAQQRLWFLQQLHPDSPVYNIPVFLRIAGDLHARALSLAFEEIVRRHESLRTMFCEVDGIPVQAIRSPEAFHAEAVDWTVIPPDRQAAELQRLATEYFRKRFDLSQGRLLRALLVRLGRNEHVLLLMMHHIVSDAWSVGALARELNTLYRDFSQGLPSSLPELPIQYADYALWQRGWLQGALLQGQLRYWRQQLADLPELLPLPVDRPRPPQLTHAGSGEPFTLDERCLESLRQLSKSYRGTLFMTVLAALQVLLARYSGQNDIAIGTPVAGRNRMETEPLIGFFVNTLVLRTNLAGNPTIQELLLQVRKTALEAFENQDVPFEKLVEELQPERDLAKTPLFQVMLAVQNTHAQEWALPGVKLSLEEVDNGTAEFDLAVFLYESGRGLQGSFRYRTDLFDASTIRRMAHHFRVILQAFAGNLQQRVYDIPLLTEGERFQVLKQWSHTERPYLKGRCMHEFFEEQAAKTPQSTAMVHGRDQVTYGELNRRANQLAHYLRKVGVGPDVLVTVCLSRTPNMIVALLAVLKAGGAYVAVDPAYPAERLQYILNDVKPKVALVEGRSREQLPAEFCSCKIVSLDSDGPSIAQCSTKNPGISVAEHNLAYVMYTSGSTGHPKGVGIEHRSTTAFLGWLRETLTDDDLGCVLASTSICFDISVTELFGTLTRGGKLLLAENVLEAAELPDSHLITLINTVPSAMRELVSALRLPSEVRVVMLAGEALDRALVTKVYEHAHVEKVFNLYGPTEDTIYSTCALMEKTGGGAPIGTPLSNKQSYVLDPWLRPVPIGVVGSIYLGGVGLARGYQNRPDLTAEKFIPDPFAEFPGARLYCTGDLGRWNNRGDLEYVGRADDQVKIRGYRIELAEIESALSQHDNVRQGVVAAQTDSTGRRILVAYAVPSRQPAPSPENLRSFLQRKLPEYMVPSRFVLLPELPLNSSGKVDRRALPKSISGRSLSKRNGSLAMAEETLLQIWEEVLGENGIDRDDNFFHLGGHSLLAMVVAARVQRAFGLQVPIRWLFQYPTIAGLASQLSNAGGANANNAPLAPIPRVERDRDLPLSSGQHQLWLVDQLEPGSSAYNIYVVWRLKEPLNLAALRAALQQIVTRHAILRTHFEKRGEEPVQVIDSPGEILLPVLSVAGSSETERLKTARELALAEVKRPFRLHEVAPLRTVLLQINEEQYWLVVTMHHIVTDGYSIDVFARELDHLYEAFSTGAGPNLPDLPIQYADYAVWQNGLLQGSELKEELDYWRRQLDGIPSLLDLPTDRPRALVGNRRGSTIPFKQSAILTTKLEDLCRREGVTLFMTLLAAFKVLLFRQTGQDDIAVGTPIAGRNRTETENLIGFFVNTLVLRSNLSGEPSFRELLKRVRETALEAYAHPNVPFETLVEELRPERDPFGTPLFQVMFLFQSVSAEEPSASPLRAEMQQLETGNTKFELSLSIFEAGNELRGAFTYDTDLFDAWRIQALIKQFEALLMGIVENPGRKVTELPLLSETESQLILAQWNQPQSPAG